MVKIQYNGDVSPGRVRVLGQIYHFERGQIIDMDEESAKKLTLNKDYVRVEDKQVTGRKAFKAEKVVKNEEDE